MKNVILSCTKCRKEFPPQRVYPRCSVCNEPLEVTYPRLEKGEIPGKGTLLERFRNFLPFEKNHREISLGEGNTPLIKSTIAAAEIGINSLFFKNESQNPTWSFKDRGTIAGLEHALSLGYRRIATVSTGNMATSVAAYGAHAGLETYVLVPHTLPREKIAPIAVYSPHLIMVDGDYGDLYYRSLEIGEKLGLYFINSDVPFRVEGSKTIAFEICEQLDFDVPDYVAVPVSAGGNIRGIVKGFEEFYHVGLIGKMPRMIAAQAAGCSPIVNAYEEGRETIERIRNPLTIAHAIENPFPPSGNQALRILKRHNGVAVKVDDSEILGAQELMARDGIFGQPAAAVPLAAVKKLMIRDDLHATDSVLCIATGSGLKYTAALEKKSFDIKTTSLERLGEAFGL